MAAIWSIDDHFGNLCTRVSHLRFVLPGIMTRKIFYIIYYNDNHVEILDQEVRPRSDGMKLCTTADESLDEEADEGGGVTKSFNKPNKTLILFYSLNPLILLLYQIPSARSLKSERVPNGSFVLFRSYHSLAGLSRCTQSRFKQLPEHCR